MQRASGPSRHARTASHDGKLFAGIRQGSERFATADGSDRPDYQRAGSAAECPANGARHAGRGNEYRG